MNATRVRWAVRGVLVVGVAASTAANILHAADNPISRAIAAWPPLALLITIEVVARVPVHRRHLAAMRILAAAVISGIAAWASYWHMVGVAVRYGETGASAYLLPLSVDGLVVVASICLVELSAGQGQPDRALPVHADTSLPVPPVRVDRVPVFQHPRPIGPRPARVDRPPVDSTPAQVDRPTPAGGQLSNAARVVAAHGQHPTATDGQLADQLGVSTKTIRRYRPRTPTGRVNGRTPQLTT